MDSEVDRIAELLVEWGRWVARENRSGLGYARPVYAQLLARASSASDWSPDVDGEVLQLDAVMCRLPADYRIVIRLHYVEPGRLAAKYEAAGMSKQAYHENLRHARLNLAHLLAEVSDPCLRELSD